jgi:hypothetical protein
MLLNMQINTYNKASVQSKTKPNIIQKYPYTIVLLGSIGFSLNKIVFHDFMITRTFRRRAKGHRQLQYERLCSFAKKGSLSII